jgi:GT2 family glycosyltransferase
MTHGTHSPPDQRWCCPDAPLVSVIIPNFNGRRLLDAVLSSIQRQTFHDVAVTVVDNGSSDDSADHLARSWPTVSLIRLSKNRGFAGAVNAGLASYEEARYVALVNNDVELESRWLENLVALIETAQSIGSVTGKLLDYHDRRRFHEAGTTFAWEGAPRMRGHGEVDNGQYDEVTEVFSVCAGAALDRRAALDVIGGFDESYFAYLEDVDWGFRARLAGYRAVYTPDAVAYHMGSVTTNALRLPVRYLSARNTLALIIVNYPRWALVRHLPDILLLQVRYFARALRHGWAQSYLRALRDLFRARDSLRHKRTRVTSLASAGVVLDIPARHGRVPE